MFVFGTGQLIGTPLTDATGAAITNPSPIQLGTLQDLTADISSEIKTLYGSHQYPVAAGRGKGKASLTAKFATINAGLFNAFVFGQTFTSGSFGSYVDSVGSAIPATPFTITVAPPGSGTYGYDLGVQSGAGVPYTRVASGPTAGQYSVNTTTGVYTFAAADTGKTVFVSYNYALSGAGQKLTVANLPMGYAPFLQIDQSVSYQGKALTIRWPQVMAGGLKFDFKNDDFSVPDMSFEAFADASGNICYLSASE